MTFEQRFMRDLALYGKAFIVTGRQQGKSLISPLTVKFQLQQHQNTPFNG
ncbi:hypothetical protein NKH33_09645 [Mesorhizobium sp. M1182]